VRSAGFHKNKLKANSLFRYRPKPPYSVEEGPPAFVVTLMPKSKVYYDLGGAKLRRNAGK
jgi:hypothetical protein